MTDKAAGLLIALVGAGAAVAVLQGWRQLGIFILVLVGGAAAWRALAGSARHRRLVFGGIAMGAIAFAAVLVGSGSSVAPQSPVVLPGSPPVETGPDVGASSPSDAVGPAGQDGEAAAPPSCQDQKGLDVPCTTLGAALVLSPVGECSRDGVAVTWGLDPDLDNLLINAVPGSDGDTCMVSVDESAWATGATAVDLHRAQKGTVSASLRACGPRDGSYTVACTERHELEFIGPWRAESSGHVSESCHDEATRYTGINLSGPGQPLSGVALLGHTSAGERQVRCAVVADRVLDDTVRSLGNAELPTADG